MGYKMYLALELYSESLKWQKKSGSSAFTRLSTKGIRDQNSELSARLLGTPLFQKGVMDEVWVLNPSSRTDRLDKAWLYGLRRGNPVLVLALNFQEDELSEVSRYRKLKSPGLLKVLKPLGLDFGVSTQRSVYPVIGTIGPKDSGWQPLTQDGWAHIHGEYVESVLLGQIVTRVAIERSLLGWATWKPITWSWNVFHDATAFRLARSWRVELLSDWTEVSRLYSELRESLNLHRVRQEVLEAGKHWWTRLGALLALAAAIAALVPLWLG
jgi:hypothetical protein